MTNNKRRASLQGGGSEPKRRKEHESSANHTQSNLGNNAANQPPLTKSQRRKLRKRNKVQAEKAAKEEAEKVAKKRAVTPESRDEESDHNLDDDKSKHEENHGNIDDDESRHEENHDNLDDNEPQNGDDHDVADSDEVESNVASDNMSDDDANSGRITKEQWSAGYPVPKTQLPEGMRIHKRFKAPPEVQLSEADLSSAVNKWRDGFKSRPQFATLLKFDTLQNNRKLLAGYLGFSTVPELLHFADFIGT